MGKRRFIHIGGQNWKAYFLECSVTNDEFNIRHQITKWKFIVPVSYEWGKTGDKHGIHIQARPLDTLAQDCEDYSAKAVMNHLFDLAKRWLDYDASHPIQVLSPFKCEGDEASTHHDQMENPDLDHLRIASLLLTHVDELCQEYISELEDPIPGPLYVQWVDDNDGHYDSVFLDLTDRNRLQAFIRLMRNPGPYDGGCEYMFERYMSIAISLLYKSQDISWVGDLASWREESKFTGSTAAFPLIVVGGSSQFGPEEQRDIATSAYEILCSLAKLEKEAQKPIPHKVVYGLHLDNQKLRILAHFLNQPGSKPNSQWNCCQAVIAQHLITLTPDCTIVRDHDEDDTFLDRWRITRALFTIRREVEILKKEIEDRCSPKGIQALRTYTNTSSRADTSLDHDQLHFTKNAYINALRSYWRHPSGFSIPEEWMPDQAMPLLPPNDWDPQNWITRELLPKFPRILLKRVQHLLQPLRQDQVQRNSQDQSYNGPDFIHPIDVPRSNFSWEILRVSRETTTEPHLTKLYDILSLYTLYNRDINIWIANTFANMAGYDVKWRPTTFQSTNRISVDFVLTVKQMEQKADVPLFFGLYLLPINANNIHQGSEISDQSIPSRTRSITDLVTTFMNHHTPLLKVDRITFCSVLISQSIHIYGLEKAGKDTVLHHVDEIRICPTRYSDIELAERLRLTMALFTIKRYVFNLAKRLRASMGGIVDEDSTDSTDSDEDVWYST